MEMQDNITLTKSKEFSIHYNDIQTLSNSPLEHSHDSFELDFFISARLNIFIKDVSYSINDGDMLFIDEYEIHRMIYTENTRYTRYVLNFKREFLMPLLKHMDIDTLLDTITGKNNKKISLSMSQRKEIEELFYTLHKLSKRLDGSKVISEITALIKSYLVIILLKLKNTLKDELDFSSSNRKNLLVQEIVNYIDEKYASDITLDSLQDIFCASKFYISHIYKEVTGFSVIEYIQYRRIIEAQKQLMTSADITEVCFSCGFSNLPHFYRVFKKISGMTPYKYKKLKKE